MAPKFFSDPLDFRKWLAKNHQKKSELWVGFHKVASGKPSMTWSESVDQALCFGWIDGVRRSLGEDGYEIRFSPRKRTSIWSAINLRKVGELAEKGLMQKAGTDIFESRSEAKSRVYSFENKEVGFSPEFEKKFKANKAAWKYFQALAPSYRRTSAHWVMSAKHEATRVRRLHALMADSAAGTNKWKHNKYAKK